MSEKDQGNKPDLVQMAIDNPNVLKAYLNGFQIAGTNSDIVLIGQLNGRPSVVVNMPFEIAKTLVQKLGNTIKEIESKLGKKFVTTDDFDAAIAKSED